MSNIRFKWMQIEYLWILDCWVSTDNEHYLQTKWSISILWNPKHFLALHTSGSSKYFQTGTLRFLWLSWMCPRSITVRLCWYFGSSWQTISQFLLGCCCRASVLMRNLFTYSDLLWGDAAELFECFLPSSLPAHLGILADWIMTMKGTFLGCLANVSRIRTLPSTYACQDLNEAVQLPPDARWQSVCVHYGATVWEWECAYLFGYSSSSK